MRKWNLLIVFALLLALVSGGVMAQDGDLANVDPTGQTITYWHQFSNAQLDTMTALIDDFNATNAYGITVNALAQGNYNALRDLMNAAIISGELPNLVAGYSSDAASYFNDNAVVDLNTYVNDPKWGLTADEMADINSAILKADIIADAPYDGAMVAWPHQNSAQVLAVNMSLLKQAGIDAPPATIEEFKDANCKVAALTGPNGEDIQGFPITTDSSVFETFDASMGGSIFHDGAYDFTSDAAINTFQLLQDMYKEGCAYIPDSQYGNTDDFALGLNPMATTSTAGLTFIIAGLSKAGISPDWIVTTLPSTEGNRTLQVFVPSIILLPSTPEKQLASWLFLKYLVSPEAAAKWSAGTGYFNPVKSSEAMLTEETFPDKTLFPYFDAASKLQNDPAIKIYASPSMSSYGTVRNAVGEAVAAVTANGEDVMTVATKLEADANAVLAETQS